MSAIDFASFCDTEIPQFAQPMVVDGRRYYTDGYVCIRVPCDEPDTAENQRRFRADSLEWDIAAFAAGQPWPALDVVEEGEPCDACICDACGGLGEVDGFDGDEVSCGSCGGSGIAPGECPECGSTLTVQRPAYQRIGEEQIGIFHDRKIRGLPGVMIVGVPQKNKPVYFRFTGGEGAVMPRYDHDYARMQTGGAQ